MWQVPVHSPPGTGLGPLTAHGGRERQETGELAHISQQNSGCRTKAHGGSDQKPGRQRGQDETSPKVLCQTHPCRVHILWGNPVRQRYFSVSYEPSTHLQPSDRSAEGTPDRNSSNGESKLGLLLRKDLQKATSFQQCPPSSV